MLSDLLTAIQLLSGKITEFNSKKSERIGSAFDSVIEESYKDLRLVHQDYSTQLSTLREHLIRKTLPPKDLILWFRNAGLEYRERREELRTIDVELKRLTGKSVDPNKNSESRFNWHFQNYIMAVLAYTKCTISYQDKSFYRDYERNLSSLLVALEKEHEGRNSQPITKIFYETDFVQDMNTELIEICDEKLPTHWKKVTEEYRLSRAALQNL